MENNGYNTPNDCTHNCNTCGSDCSARNVILKEQLNSKSSIKKVIGVVSGKGGVGKSTVTSLLAVRSVKNGYKTAILDADITGPSIPKAFGINKKAVSNDDGMILPCKSTMGIDIMSINLILEEDTTPVVWRGPVIAGAVKQFWTETLWENIDYMFIDMPPGTGDVPLTVFQSLPIDGIVIVTTPQDLVSMIVEKAINMAKIMNIPILAIIENMSYMLCPDCNKKLYPFGKGKLDDIAKQYNIKNIYRLPISADLSIMCDKGSIEDSNIDINII